MVDKVILSQLANLQNETTAVNTINGNSILIASAFDNTLSRDGTLPNQMGASIDMNSNRILNLPSPVSSLEPLRLQDLTTFIGGGTISTIPAGGSTSQVLGKLSNADYAVGWQNPNAQLPFQYTPAGRITLTSGVPLTASDVTAATTVYYSAVAGQFVPVFDGTTWTGVDISSDLSLALDSTNTHVGYHQSGRNFDVFIARVSGTNYFGTGPAWSGNTSRGTGAGTTELQLKNGLLTNKNSIVLRYGSAIGNVVTVPVNQAFMVGSIRTTADGQTEDSLVKRFTSNAYNTFDRAFSRQELTTFWTYNGAFRQVNGNSANQTEWLHCVAGRIVSLDAVHQSTGGTNTWSTGIGIDSASTNGANQTAMGYGQTILNTSTAIYRNYPGIGYHLGAWLEYGGSSITFYGNAELGAAPPFLQTGLSGWTVN